MLDHLQLDEYLLPDMQYILHLRHVRSLHIFVLASYICNACLHFYMPCICHLVQYSAWLEILCTNAVPHPAHILVEECLNYDLNYYKQQHSGQVTFHQRMVE